MKTSLALLLALVATAAHAQPADPNDDAIGSLADFSTVTVGPLPGPESSEPKETTDRLLAENPATPNRRGLSLTMTLGRDSRYRAVYEQLSAHGGIYNVLSHVGAWLDVPADLRVVFGECKQKNAFYAPGHQAIVMCYELVASFAEYFRDKQHLAGEELGRAVVGATVFSLLHEMGHAFSDLFGFPMLGNEEDAADRIAALLLLEEGDLGVSRAYAGAFGLLSLDDGSAPAWFDEHSAGPARYHNVMCLLVGADASNMRFVSDPGFRQHRAERCPGEYAKARASLDALLVPYYKKGVDAATIELPTSDDDLPPLATYEIPRVRPTKLTSLPSDVVAARLVHLAMIVSLLEQSEGVEVDALLDVTTYFRMNKDSIERLALLNLALDDGDRARQLEATRVARADVQQRIIALSRRSPGLLKDGRIARAITALL